MRNLGYTLVAALVGLVPAGAAGLTPKEMHDAQKLYNIKCAKCHKFYNPMEYSQTDWDVWMKKMSRKSKLKPAQEKLLSEYLQGFREGPVIAAPSK